MTEQPANPKKPWSLKVTAIVWAVMSAIVVVPAFAALAVNGSSLWPWAALAAPPLLAISTFGTLRYSHLINEPRTDEGRDFLCLLLSFLVATTTGVSIDFAYNVWATVLGLCVIVVSGTVGGTLRDFIQVTARLSKTGCLLSTVVQFLAAAWTIALAGTLFPSVLTVTNALLFAATFVGVNLAFNVAFDFKYYLDVKKWLPTKGEPAWWTALKSEIRK